MSVRCDAFAPDFPSISFAEGHGAGVLPATSALRSLFTATILVLCPSFLDLLISSIATCPRNMKISIEKWGEWSEKKKKGKRVKKYFPTPANTLTQRTAFACRKHKPNQIDKHRRTSSGYTARERGSHGFCAQHWTGHPLLSFLPGYRFGIPQQAYSLRWWHWSWK